MIHRWFSQNVDLVIYINGTGAITPQKTFDGRFVFEANTTTEPILWCQEPDYKTCIDPRAARRMSRVIKMGVASALIALKDGGVECPDAIVTGSGFGCMADTELFLTSIIKNEEKFLNPAPFIHSTHNTISSQIALLKKCTGYNQTYVHGPISFESALLDGMMLLDEEKAQSVLVGGVDEMTSNLFSITSRFDKWKEKPNASECGFFGSDSKGSIAGEGSVFFLLSKNRNENSYGRIIDVDTFLNPNNQFDIKTCVDQFLNKAHVKIDDLNLCLIGKSGDNRFDTIYDDFISLMSENCSFGYFKHLCGEYLTASSFAVWMSAQILNTQILPKEIIASGGKKNNFKNILIYNQYRNKYHSLILLSIC
ncbi:beta-ketoacyl synthase chain length factor [bacterium]|nr:beta-ketoacyl synthase chain length factor [bacterium]